MPIKVGIIGGTGLEDPFFMPDGVDVDIKNNFGPGMTAHCGVIGGVEVAIISRHGKDHGVTPSNVNFRENIWGLKELGCTHVIATNACGSLWHDYPIGSLVLFDQFLDFTKHRNHSFYDNSSSTHEGVKHLQAAHPFNQMLSNVIYEVGSKNDFAVKKSGTIVVVEGPRFSTKAESFMFRSFGAHCVGMTSVPECTLALEAGLIYCGIGIISDFDCWNDQVESVGHAKVVSKLEELADDVKKLIFNSLPEIAKLDWSDEIKRVKQLMV